MFCFTFVSDHNTDYIMLYSVQLKNMYSYLNSSLKLSDIVRGLPGESIPPCRGLWGTLHTGDDIDCITCLLWEC